MQITIEIPPTGHGTAHVAAHHITGKSRVRRGWVGIPSQIQVHTSTTLNELVVDVGANQEILPVIAIDIADCGNGDAELVSQTCWKFMDTA